MAIYLRNKFSIIKLAKKLSNLSIVEWINLEQETDDKYEYHDGSVYAMAGGTLNHGLICGNVFGEIRAAIKTKKRDCKVMNSEIKLHVKEKNSFLYPDAMVICGTIEKSEIEPNSVTNPVEIIEVLSKSTANYDRGDKFYFYRQIDTLKEYILIEQEKAQVEIYKKKGDLWKITRISGIDNQLPITSLNINLKLEDIYQDITF